MSEQPLTPEQERLAEASGHPFDPGDHDPALIDDNHLCHECGHPRRLHVSEVEVAVPWTCEVCGAEITTRAEAVAHAETELHRTAVARRASLTPASDSPVAPLPAEIEHAPSEEEVLASGTARVTTAESPFERGFQQGYAYARWRGDLKRPSTSTGGVIREVDLFDWIIRVVVLIVGLLIGLALAHYL
jgi:ribosomal protein L37AE/L43A